VQVNKVLPNVFKYHDSNMDSSCLKLMVILKKSLKDSFLYLKRANDLMNKF
jgi:hypothetical protein